MKKSLPYKSYLKLFAYFKIRLFGLILSYKISLHILDTSFLSDTVLQIFSPRLCILFHLLDGIV